MQYSAPNFTWSGPHMGLSGTKHQKTNFANSFGANLLPDIPEITGFICQYSIQICIKFCENKCTLKWFKSKRWQQCIFPASFWGSLMQKLADVVTPLVRHQIYNRRFESWLGTLGKLLVSVTKQYKSLSWRWDTRTWRDISSYLFTYLPLNYDTPVVR